MIALLVGATACQKADLAAGVSDSAFVATMAELRTVSANHALDSVRVAAERASVLQRRGLTSAQLERAAQALAGDPDRASKVWQAIARKSDSTARHP